eukprot:CAMPEP_0206310074 /NCGR_PEP_ID=MMETSP0106_2-20121207/12726_1 /ASSEMBLY_ACC=CAM_ASM_000206 /TAXON_ID=81532 /ORGANISM="Acanthoeca-like sp., Strain 10tr" /LENGTH=30 /DNA_ID= /DNA_START= /DNA_END= /DNA_ORIENTATION=
MTPGEAVVWRRQGIRGEDTAPRVAEVHGPV